MTRPSTKLRANGNYIENIDNCPFVLRLSKHERIISHTLQSKNNGITQAALHAAQDLPFQGATETGPPSRYCMVVRLNARAFSSSFAFMY